MMAMNGHSNGQVRSDGGQPARTMLILYGSETGNAQDIAEDLDRCVQRLHFTTKVEEMGNVQLSSLLQYSLVVFIAATTGQGDLTRNASAFWKKLLRKKLGPGSLAAVNFSTFGLGDSSYPKFNWASRKLHRRLTQLGATEFFPSGEADERHEDGTDGLYLRWSQNLRDYLLTNWPLPHGIEPIPDDIPLPPRFSLHLQSGELPTRATTNTSKGAYTSRLPVPEGQAVILTGNERITPPEYDQDVRHITLDLLPDNAGNNVDLSPGDTITIYPSNRPADVQNIIDWMGWGPQADVPINWGQSERPPNLYVDDSFTLRDVLLHNLDITAVPKRSFLKNISYFASDPGHQERLLEFTMPDYIDEYYDYTTRPRRTILEVLQEFTSVRIPAERVLDTFPIIRGREFSIANGGAQTQHPTDASKRRVEIVVALVRYKTILRKERQGLCSRYLEDLPEGASLTILHKKTLTPTYGPEKAKRPLVGVATGTGVAPIRSLIWERATYRDVATTHLFVGFRSRSADFHFSNEWLSLRSLELHPAESRNLSGRTYVQDLVRKEAKVVADMIRRKAIFFICGGSHKMAQAVRDAVLYVAETEMGAQTKEEQERIFESLEWVQEIW